MTKKIILTGGATGGHIFPLLSIAGFLIKNKKFKKSDLIFIGGKGMESKLIPAKGFQFHAVSSGKLRRYFSILNFIDPFKILVGTMQAIFLLKQIKPKVVFAKGGFVSIPTGVATYLLGIPLVIHESDSRAGLANKILSRFATKICTGFKETLKSFPHEKTVFTGNIISQDFKKANKKNALTFFKLSANKKIIFVTGGSQGATSLNKLVLKTLPTLLKNYQIVHQTGVKNLEEVEKFKLLLPNKLGDNYHPMPFIGEEMKDILLAADLIISRAGAQNLAEIAYFGKPALLFPLPGVTDQLKNARIFEKAKASKMFKSNTSPKKLVQEVKRILGNKKLHSQMSTSAKKLATPNATAKITKILLKLID